ncbi:MAG: type I-U CRISPR-associated helicase/endonuclease Cas3 [Verrucomicrobia bacterium]|nr:type I-U CRISPR-associated helicase/endonuclease Cas3 [Verrucomicrobiota bacterium]
MSMHSSDSFEVLFEALTGHKPFPWQQALFREFVQERYPHSLDIPTGLGKTGVIAIWLIALVHGQGKLPRRLVYVVNRRTVVDQATDEAKKLRENVDKAGLIQPLQELCALPCDKPLAISTLRGQFADNGEWIADPARPAIIIGTVDMVGSRLLFSGYGRGFKTRPLHAGFLGQDTLLVHDEAHLEPAFQKLIVTIEAEQQQHHEFGRFHVMALTATSRASDDGTQFGLTDADRKNGEVKKRIKAKKAMQFHSVQDENEIADKVAAIALKHKDSNQAILVFLRRLKDVKSVAGKLPKKQVQVLTGTMRGLERDKLAKTDPIFARFMPPVPDMNVMKGTVYLVCTSAGEVGVNISADHMVCDLTPFDSMAQRFGRVNRYGEGDALIDVVYEAKPTEKKKDDGFDQRRWLTLNLLQKLKRDASPASLSDLPVAEQQAAFTPSPVILPATDILFDAWALTTIREKLPARPLVAPYLHGLSEWEPPETHVAWREEVGVITGELLERYKHEDLLDDYPLRPHELLRDTTFRVVERLDELVKRLGQSDASVNIPAWVVDGDGTIEVCLLAKLVEGDRKTAIKKLNGKTVLLPPAAGGLDNGMLSSDSLFADDVADEWRDEKGRQRRVRVWKDNPQFDEMTRGMRLIREIDTKPDADEDEEESEAPGRRYWLWYELPKGADNQSSVSAQAPVKWDDHTNQVENNVIRIAKALKLPPELLAAVKLAAQFHDLGKKRERWQRSIGNLAPTDWYAKSGKDWKRRDLGKYRHEFGSLLDVLHGRNSLPPVEFAALSDEMKDLVLHLIAAHHGYARPHFPTEEMLDPERSAQYGAEQACEIPRRFARLQHKYGRWGLAYLESLLRAADYAASANPDAKEDQP